MFQIFHLINQVIFLPKPLALGNFFSYFFHQVFEQDSLPHLTNLPINPLSSAASTAFFNVLPLVESTAPLVILASGKFYYFSSVFNSFFHTFFNYFTSTFFCSFFSCFFRTEINYIICTVNCSFSSIFLEYFIIYVFTTIIYLFTTIN